MLALPISIVVSLALAYLLARMRMKGRVPVVLSALLLACILQGVVNALSQYYAIALFRLAQPVTAVAIPPFAWLALRSVQERGRASAFPLLHFIAPAFVGFCVVTAREAIDPAVVAIFAGYGAAMMIALRPGADALPGARLGAGDWPPLVWRAMAATLIVSALSDATISIAVMFGDAWLKAWIVSFGSSAALLLIGVLASSDGLGRPGSAADATIEEQNGAEETENAVERERDRAIMTELDVMLGAKTLYRDSDLTLARLAKRMGLPAKRVSEAINRETGGNVSRHVNAYRIADACSALETGRSVTEAMLESGFNTKSNFNREFRRVTGKPPSVWLANRHGARRSQQTPPRLSALSTVTRMK